MITAEQFSDSSGLITSGLVPFARCRGSEGRSNLFLATLAFNVNWLRFISNSL